MKVKKSPPLKKRHTKPCKFFQFGRCSNTAEECNFAHVLVLPGPSLPFPMATSPTVGAEGIYRYLAVGQCPNERACGMHHIYDVNTLGTQLTQMHLGPSSALSPTPYAGTFVYPSPYPPCYNIPWPQRTWAEQPFTTPIINNGYPQSGHSNRASKTELPSISISTPTAEAPKLARIDKAGASDLVSEASVMNVDSSHDHDDSIIVTEDPRSPEHIHNKHQSQVQVIDEEHNFAMSGYELHVHSGGYPMSWTPSWDAGEVYYFSQATGSRNGNQKTSARSKLATRKYKTKPCKYFSTKSECPNGDNCTFIHDTSIFSVPPTVRSCLESPTMSGNDNHVIISPLGTDKDNDNTEKSISQAKDVGSEDSNEKNFFPVTWRVIGGGVLIGGKRTENLGGEKQCGVESPEEPTSSKEPLIESSDGVGDVVTEGKSCMAAPRPRSGSASTPPIARPRTVIGIRRCRDDLFLAESP